MNTIVSKVQKIGLYFGSFNPIHNGHLMIANYMVENTELDEVWFVVSPKNPLKEKRTLLSEFHRLAMVKIAVEDNPKFKASDIEFKMSQPSYTSHTLAYISEKYPNKEFCLIMGGDNLATFEKWKNFTFILKNYSIFVYPRPNADIELWKKQESIHIVEVPLLDLSASFIRLQVAKRKSIRYYVPDAVINYIEEMHFYQKT